MKYYFVSIAYKGTHYHGFQVQKNCVTVCQVFQDALEAILGTRPDVKGCSRTDAGVHALDFGISFAAECRLTPERLIPALNAHLPPDVRVNWAREVAPDFHARYSAHQKTYSYRIRNGAVDSPFDAEYTHRIPSPRLDTDAMERAAALFVGTHDFLALCSSGSSVAAKGDTVRTITDCHVTREGELVTITVTADGYLYNMVRILAGTLAEVGTGRIRPEDIPAILESRDRKKAGPTLPPQGLFLVKVDYGPDFKPSQNL